MGSIVEKECWVIDEGPSQILGGGKPGIGKLAPAKFDGAFEF